MNQFQNQILVSSVREAIAATDKALAVLSAYEYKPDPMLIEVAIDYLEEVGGKYLRNAEAFASDGFEGAP